MGDFEPAPAEQSGEPSDEGAASFGLQYALVAVGIGSLTDGATGYFNETVVEVGRLATAVGAQGVSHRGQSSHGQVNQVDTEDALSPQEDLEADSSDLFGV